MPISRLLMLLSVPALCQAQGPPNGVQLQNLAGGAFTAVYGVDNLYLTPPADGKPLADDPQKRPTQDDLGYYRKALALARNDCAARLEPGAVDTLMGRIEGAQDQMVKVRAATYEELWSWVAAADKTRNKRQDGIKPGDYPALTLKLNEIKARAAANKKDLAPARQSLLELAGLLSSYKGTATAGTTKAEQGKLEAYRLVEYLRQNQQKAMDKGLKDMESLVAQLEPKAK